jgi:DNA-binding transcriptional regulator YiaG
MTKTRSAPTQRTNLNRAIGRSIRTATRSRSAYLMHLLRRSYGLTQRQLARALGDVALETVTRWESGAQVPGPVSRRLLAHLLGCEFLVEWDETKIVDDTDAAMVAWVTTFRAGQVAKR